MTARLQDADRVRRDLMADVAHELRTPLTVLQGRLEGLVDGVYPLDKAQVAQLLEETQVLSRLVEDLRTLALSDAGALPLQKESTDLVLLASDVAAEHARARRDDCAVASNGVVLVDVDPIRIREVLTNLIANAIRHTPTDGRIDVVARRKPDGIVTISVTDTGAGIARGRAAAVVRSLLQGRRFARIRVSDWRLRRASSPRTAARSVRRARRAKARRFGLRCRAEKSAILERACRES